jgi:uncharacterized protein (DUF2141 family)
MKGNYVNKVHIDGRAGPTHTEEIADMPCLMKLLPAALALMLAVPGAAQARPADGSRTILSLTVIVTGADRDGGRLGVALFGAADGFPGEPAKAAQQSVLPRRAPIDSVVFRGLAPGKYAVSVYHDLNNNGTLDTNMFGVPKEPWGTTGTVRPRLRAPRFSEAQFDVTADTRVEVRVER